MIYLAFLKKSKMNKIIHKEFFSDKVVSIWVEAPMIAKSRKAGHFVIIRTDEKGERIPLTIAGANLEEGTINLIIQMVGVTSSKIAAMNEGDYLLDVVGPLGKATDVERWEQYLLPAVALVLPRCCLLLKPIIRLVIV